MHAVPAYPEKPVGVVDIICAKSKVDNIPPVYWIDLCHLALAMGDIMLPLRFVTAALAALSAIAVTAAAAQTAAATGQCPQPRFTGKAPAEYLERTNPLAATPQNLKAGEQRYLGTADNEYCAICHGRTGDGKGALARQYDPPPRNFACAKTVNGVADGQLFWIIRYGSPDTAMPPHAKLNDEQIWQLVLHLRQLAK